MSQHKQNQPPTNDNSNPQQGTMLKPNQHHGSKWNQHTHYKSDGSTPSNMSQQPSPHYGAITDTAFPQRPFKIPPTKKDNRKLFVGGLPSNSKWYTKIERKQ